MARKLPFDSTIFTRGVASGVRLGRGTADRLVGAAGPPLGRLTERMASKVRRPEPPTTTTFTPSRKPAETAVPEPPAAAEPTVPSPASVARNIGPQRPTAKPAQAAKPRSAPGAKLPPPRPSTS